LCSVIEGIVLSKAASIDCPSAKGRDTPLHLAARNGANEALAMCLKLKADVSLKNAEGRSALQEALYSRSIKKVRISRAHHDMVP
jgi:ankyrin repeat protein